MFADHLELLHARLERFEKIRATKPGGREPGAIKTNDEIIAQYHNAPCTMRLPDDSGMLEDAERSANNAVAATHSDASPEATLPEVVQP